MAPRVLICGDVLGRFNALFKRITTVNKANGPFDVLLCVGQFFPNTIEELDEMLLYIQGEKEIPLPTYFIGDFGEGVSSVLSAAKLESASQGFQMEGIPVCKNLYWLKGSGKFILHGLSVAYLAGRSSSNGSTIGVYCEDDIDALRALAEESGVVDMFLTNEWPEGILRGANLADAPPGIEHLSGGNTVILELVRELKPRYHIAGCEGIFYAREPYTNDGASHITRFIGVAAVGNDKKQFVPIPLSKASAVRSEFISAGKKLGFEFDVVKPGKNDDDTKMSLKKLLHGGNGYFFVELPEGTILAHMLESGEKLPMQFGREVLATLLGKKDRSDWKNCKLSKEEETSMAEDFKNRFESFDPMIST